MSRCLTVRRRGAVQQIEREMQELAKKKEACIDLAKRAADIEARKAALLAEEAKLVELAMPHINELRGK